jgi:hypothetical protein
MPPWILGGKRPMPLCQGAMSVKPWLRESVLMVAGLLLIGASFVVSEVRGGDFHFEFLLAGLALCGISITQFGDRK